MDAVRSELIVLINEIQPPNVAIDWEQMKRIASIVAGHPSTAVPVLRPLYDIHRLHQSDRSCPCGRCDRIGWLVRQLEGLLAASLPTASWDEEEDTKPHAVGQSSLSR
jgi:hypothetical protein